MRYSPSHTWKTSIVPTLRPTLQKVWGLVIWAQHESIISTLLSCGWKRLCSAPHSWGTYPTMVHQCMIGLLRIQVQNGLHIWGQTSLRLKQLLLIPADTSLYCSQSRGKLLYRHSFATCTQMCWLVGMRKRKLRKPKKRLKAVLPTRSLSIQMLRCLQALPAGHCMDYHPVWQMCSFTSWDY